MLVRLDGFDVFFSTVFMSLVFQAVLRDDGGAVCCVDKVYLLLQLNTLIATRLIHKHMKPSLQALDAFAEEEAFQHSIEDQDHCGNSADGQKTWNDLGGEKLPSVFVDNISGFPVHREISYIMLSLLTPRTRAKNVRCVTIHSERCSYSARKANIVS